MLITHNFKKFGLVRQELEHLIDEGMDPYECCLYEDPVRDPEDGRTYEERRFDEMWECDSPEFKEESDDFPLDDAAELDSRQEQWRRQVFYDEYIGMFYIKSTSIR